MSELSIDSQTSALVLIDLQKGVVERPWAPHSGSDVVKKAVGLAGRFREKGATIVMVHVSFHLDFRDMLKSPVETPPAVPPGSRPPDWAEFVPELTPQKGDLVITKRQWGAFYGTELDLQLRRRGVRTIVLGGIATNMGVESTARAGHEHGYEMILVEDAMSSFSADAHQFAVSNIFPRLGRVRSANEIISAIR
ncbi:MAG: hydrolase [Nitrospinae bacterium]|nr:hydrolase [Nitrospinota bacterium]